MTFFESVHEPDAAAAKSVFAPFRPVPSVSNSRVTTGSEEPRRADLLASLYSFSAVLVGNIDRAAIEKHLVEIVERIFPTAMIVVSRGGGNEAQLACAGGKGLTAEWRCALPAAESAISGLARSAGGPMIIADSADSGSGALGAWLRDRGLTCYLRVALAARAQAVGHVSLYFNTRPALSEDELNFLGTVASQAALAIYNTQLYERAVDQSDAVRKLSEEVAKSHRAKSEFLSVVSHEFRTPLNIIMGYAALMEEELVGTIGHEQRNCLEQIRNASHDLLDLVMNMLQAGSLEAGVVPLKKEDICLGRVLRELKAELRLPKLENVRVIWDVPDALPLLTTDAEKIKQVLHNLIDNAVKFTDRGEVRIWSNTIPEHGQLEIHVSDTGIGIARDVLPLVFDRYRQLDGSINRSYDGLGLGLFIAKKLTELVGGKLHVISELGKGSTFTVVLPLGA
jgi:signal transduction histidine kinase